MKKPFEIGKSDLPDNVEKIFAHGRWKLLMCVRYRVFDAVSPYVVCENGWGMCYRSPR